MGEWCDTLDCKTPEAIRFSVELSRILSIRLGVQPGFSCVARDIVGIRLLLNIISSKLLHDDESKLILKSPVTMTFSDGKFFIRTSISL